MGSAKDEITRGYIRLPKGVRRHTDPLVRNRGKAQKHYKQRREKGKRAVDNVMRKVLGIKKK